MKKIFIQSFGCARRGLDAERIKNYFLTNGCKITLSPNGADHLVVVTCGLTEGFVKTSMKYITDLKRFKGDLIVYGCLPAMTPESLGTIFNGKIVITKDIEKFDELFPDFAVRFKDIEDVHKSLGVDTGVKKIIKEHLPVPIVEGVMGGIGINDRLPILRISEGCLGNCSYCSIKKAIGKLKSKPVDMLLYELKKILSGKKHGISIASSDSGSYGLDIDSSFPQLLEVLLKADKRIAIEFIQDLNPSWICRYNESFLRLLETKRIKSILTPIQSGNVRILKLMNRSVDINKFKEVARDMKKAYPALKIRTQVIVGFPTETEGEFQDTLDFLKEVRFDQVDMFAYYEVEGTDAKKIVPKVDPSVIQERLKRLKSTIGQRKKT